MSDPALIAAITALITALAAYVRTQAERAKRNAKDLDAVFPKIRALETGQAQLEERIEDLEDDAPRSDAPSCLKDCARKEGLT